MISSTTNKQVKYVNALIKKGKTRKEEGLFVAEGLRICREIPKNRIHTLYLSESFQENPEYQDLVAEVPHVELLTDAVFESLSDTKTPQGVLALVKQYSYTLNEVIGREGELGNPRLLMVLEGIQDPGNLGTMIRAGEGAGVTGIIMDDHTVDIYNPKVIRSTMGSVLRVPFAYTQDLVETLRDMKEDGIYLYAAHLEGAQNYEAVDYKKDTAFLIGNEANGLCEKTATLADHYIRIPMAGKVESLNAAVAASVLMFEVARQRRI